MSESSDGGQAFPGTKFERVGDVSRMWPVGGMSLRAYFAGKVIQAVIISHAILNKKIIAKEDMEHGDVRTKGLAHVAVQLANALIAELGK